MSSQIVNQDPTGYRLGGRTPNVVWAPADRAEAVDAIRSAASAGQSLVIWGGGTAIDLGFPPERYHAALSTAHLNRVIDYQPDDMTITLEPGVRLSTLQALLAERRQFLPLNPALPDRVTLGGLVSAASSGPWRAGYGTPRDWVIGLRVIGADGLEVRAGGLVVKNVAGYDLPKLYTGSHGTLGLLTEVTFKVLPMPPAVGHALIELSGATEVENVLARLRDSDVDPCVVSLLHGSGVQSIQLPTTADWTLLLEFRHFPEAVRWQLDQLSTASGIPPDRIHELSAGETVVGAVRDFGIHSPFVCRASTLSSRAAALCREFRELGRASGAELTCVSQAASGQISVFGSPGGDPSLVQRLRATARQVGGNLVAARVPETWLGEVDPWGDPGAAVRLISGIKKTLDPTGLFAPGRMAGRV